MSLRIYSSQDGLLAQIEALLSRHAPDFLPLQVQSALCFDPCILQNSAEFAILDLSPWNELPTFISYQPKAAKNVLFYHESPTLELALQMMRRGLTHLLTPPVNPFQLLCYLDVNPAENDMRLMMQEVRAYIDRHFMEPISVGELAERFCINACRLSSLFKQYEAEGLNRYITLLRLNHAKDLLLATEKPIPEIAALSGFSSSKYFAAVFKNEAGIPPDAFRKERKRTQ